MEVEITMLIKRGNLIEELGYNAMKAKETVAKLLYGI
jgi:hypothetical protein